MKDDFKEFVDKYKMNHKDFKKKDRIRIKEKPKINIFKFKFWEWMG